MSNNQGPPQTHSLPYFVANFNERAFTVKRDSDYKTIIRHLQKSLPSLASVDDRRIIISTKLPDFGSQLIQICEETWADVVHQVTTVQITLESNEETTPSRVASQTGEIRPQSSSSPGVNQTPLNTSWPSFGFGQQAGSNQSRISSTSGRLYADDYQFSISARKGTRELALSKVRPSYPVKVLKDIIADEYKTLALLQRLYYNGKLLEDVDSVEISGITSGATIDLELDTRRIAIFLVTSGSDRDTYRSADIKYSVNRAWELTALSPATGLDYTGFTQETRWDIRIEDDGSLRDVTKSNQRFATTKFRRDPEKKLDCLLWDGLDESYTLLDRYTAPGEPTHSKDWLRSVTLVESQNSAVVRVDQLKTYLVNLLAQANWEVAQRFANCVMPDLKPKSSESWNHIAVRCLSPADSKALATISIDPQPDQVLHLALLFKPLEDSEALVWSAASVTLDNSPLLPNVQISGGFRAYELTWLKVL